MSSQLEWKTTPRLVDLLIEEQQMLSAVDDFSACHDADAEESSRYEALIPSSLPGQGEQYAFRVDLDACTGCKACVTACHNLNGLDEGELWRKVGLVEERVDASSARRPDPRTVTTACHHCEEPGCLSGCPVRAYEKDPVSGIVRHLDDQCIGCRYCELMCPYDVPTYSQRLGVVRKCDMCQGRLSSGEAPACVQGCPNEAISIRVVDTSRALPERMLSVDSGAMPESKWTRPTTTYVSTRGREERLNPVDASVVRPSHAHMPLAVMLVSTQAAIGAVCLEGLFAAWPDLLAPGLLGRAIGLSLAAWICCFGLGASFFHLGRPQWAFRAILGLRTSWMSREIVVLGGFAAALSVALAMGWFEWGIESGHLSASWEPPVHARDGVIGVALLTGLVGLFCSVKIYAVTGRPLWRFDRTLLRFGFTAVWAGLAVGSLGLTAGSGTEDRGWLVMLSALLILVSIAKLRLESGHFISSRVWGGRGETLALSRTRALLSGVLDRPFTWRRRLLWAAGCILPALQIALVVGSAGRFVIVGLAFLVLAMGLSTELLERSLFFRSEAMPGMPGVG